MSQQGLVLEGPHGRIELTGAALLSLVARSAESIAGVHVRRARRHVRVVVGAEAVQVELEIEGPLGEPLGPVGEAVQQSVAAAVGAVTGLRTSVDVAFEELS